MGSLIDAEGYSIRPEEASNIATPTVNGDLAGLNALFDDDEDDGYVWQNNRDKGLILGV